MLKGTAWPSINLCLTSQYKWVFCLYQMKQNGKGIMCTWVRNYVMMVNDLPPWWWFLYCWLSEEHNAVPSSREWPLLLISLYYGCWHCLCYIEYISLLFVTHIYIGNRKNVTYHFCILIITKVPLLPVNYRINNNT